MSAGRSGPVEPEVAPEELARELGIDLDPALLRLALTHRSFAYEAAEDATNERLEFLGDAVLGLLVTEDLFRSYGDEPEGQLAKMRASVVSTRALAEVGRTVGLGRFVRLGRGEESSGGRDKASILADTLEAVLGAVYLHGGLEPARALVERLVGPMLRDAEHRGSVLDAKTTLQELCALRGLGVPTYRVVDEGPDHAKTFSARVVLPAGDAGEGTGRTKKEAEQAAAQATLRLLADEQPLPPAAA